METYVAGLPRGWNKIVRDSRGNVAQFDFSWCTRCSNRNLFLKLLNVILLTLTVHNVD